MEITCSRCHQTVLDENCYCPTCGLPRLVYSAESGQGLPQPERGNEPVRDASTVDWKPAIRAAATLAIPAGLLSSMPSPLNSLGIFWMAAAAAWSVVLYVRTQRPAWITIGAGARIGLVTGLLGGWLAFGASGFTLLVKRILLHQSSQIDAEWKARVDASQQLAAQTGLADGVQLLAQKAFMLSPEGHAGFEAFNFASASVFLMLFAVAGGALGARLLARSRRPEI
jgi:hypothetical protein